MGKFMWGVSTNKPSRANAKKMDRICREEGGYGFTEINVIDDETPGINGGRYQGWFAAHNHGEPFNGALARRVADRIEKECIETKRRQ
jgi:hypothetical protein